MESIRFLVHELKLLHLTTQFQSSCWCQNSHRQSVEITEIVFCKSRVSQSTCGQHGGYDETWVKFNEDFYSYQISTSDFQDPNGTENTKPFHRPNL